MEGSGLGDFLRRIELSVERELGQEVNQFEDPAQRADAHLPGGYWILAYRWLLFFEMGRWWGDE